LHYRTSQTPFCRERAEQAMASCPSITALATAPYPLNITANYRILTNLPVFSTKRQKEFPKRTPKGVHFPIAFHPSQGQEGLHD
jgi:hypothetical protein